MIELLNCDCMDGEIFKNCSVDSKYLVSNFGRIYSTKSNIILSPLKLTNGYNAIMFGRRIKIMVIMVFRMGNLPLQVLSAV